MSDRSLSFLFAILIYMSVLLNMDHGSIPACTDVIQSDLGLSKIELGALGSLVFIGLTVGSSLSGFILDKCNEKAVIIVSTGCLSGSLVFFALLESEIVLIYISRVAIGLFQSVTVIYVPVWIDIIAPDNRKTLWMTILQLAVSLGVILGYIVTALISNWFSWRGSYYFQACLCIPAILGMLALPNKLFRCVAQRTTQFQNKRKRLLKRSTVGEVHISETRQNIGQYVALVKNGEYVFSTLWICSWYFMVTGIQFWVSDYMLTVIGESKAIVFPSYVIVTISAPTLGVLSGGILSHKSGGYKSSNALKLCVALGVIAWCCALPIPWFRSFWPFIIMLWLLLFFGASIMPSITGIMLSSVSSNLKYKANSTSQVTSNLLGYLPAPFFYGLICNMTGGEESPYGMLVILYWCFFALILAVLAMFWRKAQQQKAQNDLLIPFMRDNATRRKSVAF